MVRPCAHWYASVSKRDEAARESSENRQARRGTTASADRVLNHGIQLEHKPRSFGDGSQKRGVPRQEAGATAWSPMTRAEGGSGSMGRDPKRLMTMAPRPTTYANSHTKVLMILNSHHGAMGACPSTSITKAMISGIESSTT